jgi:hypothetical protein
MARRGYIREIVEVSQGELLDMISNGKSVVRAGASVDCNKRANGYEHDRYSGVMYAARTKNMMKAEDKLLEAGRRNNSCIHNQQQLSNMPESPGFVYAIKGKKFSS